MPDMSQWRGWLFAIALAFAGGSIASAIGTPLPWMLGALFAVGTAAAFRLRFFGVRAAFPQQPRMAFVAIVGVMIGGSARPEMLDEAGAWAASLVGVVVFVVVALAVNYQIFRRIAGYDRATAYYCSTPGGLIESVVLGEAAGGNSALLAVQHFSRIAITVTVVPIAFWVLEGRAVGSAAGVTSMADPVPVMLEDALLMAACAVLGVIGGKRIGLPAYVITGPIILSGIAHVTGMTHAQPPGWLIALAQLVIGTSLALRFEGLNRRDVTRGIGFAAISVGSMLLIGAAMAGALDGIGGHAADVVFLCYAPGGIVEMGLIALSLEASPVFVSLHHFLRIVVTVMGAPIVWARWLGRKEMADPG